MTGTAAVSAAAAPKTKATPTSKAPKTGEPIKAGAKSTHLLCRGPFQIGAFTFGGTGTLVTGKARAATSGAGAQGAWADRGWLGSTKVEILIKHEEFPASWVASILATCAHDSECIIDFQYADGGKGLAFVENSLLGGIDTWPRGF